MNAPKRKRIVIDLDRQAPANTRRRRTRWSRVLFLIAMGCAGFLIVAGISGYLWWRHYQTTPVYSLALIVDAAQRGDTEAFNQQVNTERVVDSLASQAAEQITSRVGVPGAILSSQLTNVTPLVPTQLKSTLREWLADEIKQFSSSFGTRPFVIIALTLPAVVKTTSEQDTARIEALLRDQPLELTMQKDGESWKLVGLKNDRLLTRVLDEVNKNLPPAPALDAVEPGTRTKKRRR